MADPLVDALLQKIKQRGEILSPSLDAKNLLYSAKAFSNSEGVETYQSVQEKGEAEINALRNKKKELFGLHMNNLGFGSNYPDLDIPIMDTLEQWDKPKRPVYRWARFLTHDQNTWVMANNSAMFGGVAPSSWGDSSYHTGHMNWNPKYLRTLFNKKGYSGYNAMIGADVLRMESSSNSLHIMALFRIRNTTSNAIMWPISFYYTAYSSWGNIASVGLNGSQIWSSGSEDTNSSKKAKLYISIPEDGTSTIIFLSANGSPSTTFGTQLGLFNNCLKLPVGLEYRDDLDALPV